MISFRSIKHRDRNDKSMRVFPRSGDGAIAEGRNNGWAYVRIDSFVAEAYLHIVLIMPVSRCATIRDAYIYAGIRLRPRLMIPVRMPHACEELKNIPTRAFDPNRRRDQLRSLLRLSACLSQSVLSWSSEF